MRFLFDGQPIEFSPGDSVLIALLRAGLRPTSGGCLCLSGDCPHCVATINGVSYVRCCQTRATPGMTVERHPENGAPPMGNRDHGPAVTARNLFCDTVVIGMGRSGRAAAEEAGANVITLDAGNGQEVIGIYPGPLVAARTPEGMLHVHPAKEIVVATGAAEIHPVAPGSELPGIVTSRAASLLAEAGVELGRVVTLVAPPTRFEGREKIEGVVVLDEHGVEQRIPCDTVSVALGFQPRDALARMGQGLPVRTVGNAARPSDIPPCPKAGTVCPCSGVTVADLESVWERGFRDLELVKRATLSGTGTCQGSVCVPHIRSFLAARGEVLQPAFTARPMNKQATMAEVAAGVWHHPTARTALDVEHRRLGAQMERMGGWWRPWTYGRPLEEYWAVREAASLGDVSTLGKMLVSGPGTLALLEHLYPTKVSSLKPGRCRYVLLLDERGYVLDDGMVCRESDTRFYLTFTSAGSTHAELWVRDWAETLKCDVRLLNQTMSLSAINVTGPLATQLLERAGMVDPPSYLQHKIADVAGVRCRVLRLSFTGEVSYELHHAASESVRLWRRLLELGRDLGIKPHGMDTLMKLRLEKGHIVVGQDTDFDSTPRRIGHEWAIKLDKPEFVGRQAVLRTNKIALDRQLAGFEMDGEPPPEGSLIWNGSEHAGYVTSSAFSPVLGKAVMLGWLKLSAGRLPEQVTIQDKLARRVATPFYDPEGTRARA